MPRITAEELIDINQWRSFVFANEAMMVAAGKRFDALVERRRDALGPAAARPCHLTIQRW